jgi:import inner membrane translocase subunit TIM50
MAQYYELVVYTDQLPTYADPILDRLDPQRYVQYRLYRDSTQYINGKHVSFPVGNTCVLQAEPCVPS